MRRTLYAAIATGFTLIAAHAQGTCQAMLDFAAKGGSDTKKAAPDCSAGSYSFLIATVPDPVNTHLALFFDRSVEAIQNAISDAGYEFDRYSFPWDPLLSRDEPDVAKREKQQSAKEEAEEQPGVLLFRGKGKDEKLAVLLVAETPTTGINRDQFEHARNYIAHGIKGHSQSLIGPTFSGSLDSLEEIDPSHSFEAYSGTAKSFASRRKFAGSFHSFVHSADWAREQLLRHIRREWGNEGSVAILTEGETAFGAGFARSDAKPDECQEGDANAKVDVIRFPREIAHLRNSYLPDQQPSAATQTPSQSGQTLPLDLRDIGGGHDSIPALSSQMALSQEAVLFGISSQLRQGRYSLIGIVATNVLDALFLSRFIRSICPDSRVFVFEQDLLYMRATAEFPLYGTLSVVTYPLLLANQRSWPTENQARIQFPDQPAEGVYNATTAALAHAKLTKGAASLLDYALPVGETDGHESGRPPLWVTVLGRNSYWPVAMVESTASEGAPLPNSACAQKLAESTAGTGLTSTANVMLVPRAPGRLWSSTFRLTSLALIGFAFLVRIARQPGKRLSKWRALFLVEPSEACTLHGRAYYLLAFGFALAAAYTIFAAPYWLLFWEFAQFREWISVGLSCLAIIAMATVLYRYARFLTLEKPGQTNAAHYRGMGIATALAGISVFILILSAFVTKRPHQEHIFAAWRSLDLVNGVAPVTPCILAALGLCCWAWVHLRRLVILDERDPSLPNLDFGELKFQFDDLRKATDAAVRDPFYVGRVRCVGATAVLLILLVIERSDVQSFESPQFRWLYLLLLGLLVAALCLTMGRFWLVWRNLSNFLVHLERHPIRLVISDLPREVTLTPFIQRELARRTHDFEIRMYETAEKLAAEEFPVDVLADFAGVIQSCMKELASGSWVPPESIRAIQEKMLLLYASAIAIARPRWQEGHSERLEKLESGGPSGPLKAADRRERICGELIALPFISYIRIILLQMRNMAVFLTLGFVLAWLSLNSYPFQSPRMLNGLMLVVLVVVSLCVTIVLAGVSKDSILSRMTQTEPGKLDKSFLVHLATAGGLPLITVVASQFPSVSRFLFSWLEPTLSALK
jgi:hypothetical protein